MITATIFSRRIDGISVYGLILREDGHTMMLHTGQDIEKAVILYERITEKPAITDELLKLRIA